jgi:transposase
VEEVDEVVVIKPEQCTHCHAPLSGDDPQPRRHQVIEIPPITPVVTEYQWHQLVCATCGEVTRAPWPAGVPSGTYGPRVQATVALYTGAYRLSKRTTQQMMDEVFGVPMSVGTISQLEQATTAAVAAPVEEAHTYVHEQAVALPRRDELAPRGQAGLVMGRSDELGDGVCGTNVTRWPRSP